MANETSDFLTRIELFQTDASINRGVSGGPMFDRRGNVVGIVSHILSHSGGFEGMGFAVTANTARDVLLEEPSFWSGAEGYFLRGRLARIFNLPQEAGILVQRVARDSPAAALGLRGGRSRATIGGETLRVGGDIVLEVAGRKVVDRPASIAGLLARLSRLQPGETYAMTVLRAGEILEVVGTIPENR